ncbi:MAG: hypothetical protein AB7T06_42925 [Kofleriaceae bacterium]
MTADEILALVRAAFEDPCDAYAMSRVELAGGDAVGTDAYPALRDAWPRLVEALRAPSADVRIAAGYGLAFILEHAAHTQPALDAACDGAELPLERAAMILSAARLRASIASWRSEPAYPWDPVPLSPEAAREPHRVVRAALAVAQVFAMSSWGRKVQREVADALDGLDGLDLGLWGAGNAGRLAVALRETLFVAPGNPASVIYSGVPPEADHDPDAPPIDVVDRNDTDGLDEVDAIDPAEQAAIDAVHAAIANAEATMAATSIADQEVPDPYTQERPVRAAGPRVLLEGLHDVDWSHLEHAYGDARGVPGMLEALSSPDAGDRAWAIDALFASINHQGSVYSASGAAAPFLAKLVAHDDLEDRASILRLLAGLAVGDPRWWLFDDLDTAASDAFDAVCAHGPLFVRLVADASAPIRAHAALVLSFITPPDGATIAVKRALAMETDRYTRASLLLALGYLGRRMKTTTNRAAIERYLDDDCMLIAGSAAIALAQLDRDACSPRAKAVLAKTITDAPPVTGVWPWNGGDIAGFARIVRLGILSDDEMLDEADAARARGDWQSGRDYAAKVLVRLFRDGVHSETRLWLPSELDDRRRRALRFLVEISPTHPGASGPQFPMDVLTAHGAGITTSVAAAKHLLGDATGPLDREVRCPSILDGNAVPAWFAIDQVVGDRAPLAELRAAFTAIAPATRVEMIEEALSGPFALWHSRSPMDFANEADYARAKDHTSRFIIAIAALLGETGLVGVAHARALAEQQVARERAQSIQCLVAAIVLASAANGDGAEPPAIIDRLVLTDQAPAGTYRIAIRAALDLLSPERRRRLLGDLPLYSYWAHRDPRGEVRRWYNERGWDLLDLHEPTACVAKIDAAWREWQRHRAAGDDPRAEPVRGHSTHSLESKPGADQDFPFDRAIAILERCGDPARSLREELQANAGSVADA